MNENEIVRFDRDMDGEMSPAEYGDWVRFEDALNLQKERDEQQKLLELVFGRSCETCSCLAENEIWCSFVEPNLEYKCNERDKRCPYLKFERKEEKK